MIFHKISMKQNTSEMTNVNTASETIFMKLWHCHLTHVNYATVWKLFAVTEDMMIVSLNNVKSCDSCLMTKATWKVLQQSIIRVMKSLKFIHTDLMRSITLIMNDK